MTTTLHPPAEDLGRFIEGTLDDAGRAAVVEHVADCDDCRIIVVDTTEFIEESVPVRRVANGRWMAIAASFILVIGAAALVWNAQRDRLSTVKEDYSKLSSRPVLGRLSGFAFVRLNNTRSGPQEDTDLAALMVQSEVGNILEHQGNSAKALHATGVAYLMRAQLEKGEPNEQSDELNRDRKENRARAIENLRAAANAAPDNAQYQSDLAAALIAEGSPQSLNLAVAACKKALQIDPRSPDALFNLAKAQEIQGKTSEALKAYKDYLAVDATSPWADEVRQEIDFLK